MLDFIQGARGACSREESKTKHAGRRNADDLQEGLREPSFGRHTQNESLQQEGRGTLGGKRVLQRRAGMIASRNMLNADRGISVETAQKEKGKGREKRQVAQAGELETPKLNKSRGTKTEALQSKTSLPAE